jgi:uncharacterized coiled-coil DUF342 family protein
MEVSQEIHQILINLRNKKINLETNLSQIIDERDIINNQIVELELKKDDLSTKINNIKQKQNEINNTLNETEIGYSKIIEACETLKEIITKNIETYDLVE